jgi:hypothetical protein
MAFRPSAIGGGAFGGRQDRATSDGKRVESFVKSLIYGVKAALTHSVLQEYFVFRLQFDRHCHRIANSDDHTETESLEPCGRFLSEANGAVAFDLAARAKTSAPRPIRPRLTRLSWRRCRSLPSP